MFSHYKRFKGIIDAPASVLIDLLFDNIEEQASWNKHVSESIKLQVSKTIIFSFFSFSYHNILYILITKFIFNRLLTKTQILFIKQQSPLVVGLLRHEISLFLGIVTNVAIII